jgi:hypothetical protein
MTGTAGTIFLLVCSAAVIVVTVVLVRMANQLVRTGAELERLARSLGQDLIPRAERVLEQTAGELVELRAATETARKVAQSATRAVETVGDLTESARNALTPIIGAVGEVGDAMRQVTAVAVGFKAAVGSLRRPGGTPP